MGILNNQLANVVEWEEYRDDVIFYKWNNSEIKKGSRLIIRPGQDAIFLYNGKIDGVFKDEGNFDIESDIIPFLSALKGFKFGFKTRFLRGTVAWCIMLAVDAWMFTDLLQYTSAEVSLVYPITSGVMFALMVMLTTAVMTLNVYIPTDISTWIKNATAMVFKAPLQLLAAAAAIWAPVVLFFFRFDIFYYVIMIFVVAYFTLAGFAATILLKGHLMELLLEARSEGTLLAEEGRVIEKEEEESE